MARARRPRVDADRRQHAAAALTDRRVRYVTADLAEDGVTESVIDRETTSIFHLAAVVSGQAEADFDLGMRVNVDATRRLLEVCRARGHAPRFVFTSSVAVYGGALPDVVRDDTALTPQTSYGVEKAIGEMLVSDYSRRGFVDGRILRLPTVSVRPGRPNAALSSFARASSASRSMEKTRSARSGRTCACGSPRRTPSSRASCTHTTCRLRRWASIAASTCRDCR